MDELEQIGDVDQLKDKMVDILTTLQSLVEKREKHEYVPASVEYHNITIESHNIDHPFLRHPSGAISIIKV